VRCSSALEQVPVPFFLDEIYRLHLLEQTDKALDLIFAWTNHSLKSGGAQADEALRSVDVNALDEDLLVGFLSSSYPGKNLLRNRSVFAERMLERLAQEIGQPRADALIRDLL